MVREWRGAHFSDTSVVCRFNSALCQLMLPVYQAKLYKCKERCKPQQTIHPSNHSFIHPSIPTEDAFGATVAWWSQIATCIWCTLISNKLVILGKRQLIMNFWHTLLDVLASKAFMVLHFVYTWKKRCEMWGRHSSSVQNDKESYRQKFKIRILLHICTWPIIA